MEDAFRYIQPTPLPILSTLSAAVSVKTVAFPAHVGGHWAWIVAGVAHHAMGQMEAEVFAVDNVTSFVN